MIFKINGSTFLPMLRKRHINVHFTPVIQTPTYSPETFFVPYVRKVIEAYDLEDTDISHYDYFAYERDNNQGFAVVVMLKEGSSTKYPQVIGSYYYPATTKDYFYCVDYTGSAAGVDVWTRYYTTSGGIAVGVAGITNVIYTTRNLFFSGSETASHAAGVVTDAMQERFGRVVEKLNAGQHAVFAKLLPYLQKVIDHYCDELDTTKPMSEYQFFAFERNNNWGFAIGVIPKTQNPNFAYPYYYSNYYQAAGSKNYFLFYGYDGTETYMETTDTKQINGLNNLLFTTINIRYASSSTYKYCGYVDETILARIQENGLLK